jgi:hypothetical protein
MIKLSEKQRVNQFVFGDGLTSIKKFKETFFTSSEMNVIWYRTKSLGWYYERQLLKHPCCPDYIREKYLKSKIWYQRITAMFSKPCGTKYVELGLYDPHTHVRRYALDVAIQENWEGLDLEAYAKDNLTKQGHFEIFLKEKKELLKKKNLPLALTSTYSLIRKEAIAKWGNSINE